MNTCSTLCAIFAWSHLPVSSTSPLISVSDTPVQPTPYRDHPPTLGSVLAPTWSSSESKAGGSRGHEPVRTHSWTSAAVPVYQCHPPYFRLPEPLLQLRSNERLDAGLASELWQRAGPPAGRWELGCTDGLRAYITSD